MKEMIVGYDCREPLSFLVNKWQTDRKERHLADPTIAYTLSVDFNVWPPREPYSTKLPCGLNNEIKVCAADKGLSIAVTVNDCKGIDYFTSILYGVLPVSSASRDWEFLGYDIADAYFVSALSNCGMGEEDETVKDQWKICINQWGLIYDRKNAIEFQAYANQRVGEHAPFFIYGLYLIKNWDGLCVS